jgi:dTDP-4-dehydrorhamnose 3,5-epimerase-like enzyme
MQQDTTAQRKSIHDRIRLIPRDMKVDARGWLVKVLSGFEEGLSQHTGEIYVTMALPGHSRGNHFHSRTDEWFTVLQGVADIALKDPDTGERLKLTLRGDRPETLHVPAGIAHAFTNPTDADGPMLLIAYASRPYDPEDVTPLQLE